jgi:hypothetical protein
MADRPHNVVLTMVFAIGARPAGAFLDGVVASPYLAMMSPPQHGDGVMANASATVYLGVPLGAIAGFVAGGIAGCRGACRFAGLLVVCRMGALGYVALDVGLINGDG